MSSPIWTPAPADAAASAMHAFMARINARHDAQLSDYAALHRWSIEHIPGFWSEVWDFCGVIGERGERALIDGDRMPGARFFPGARLNFAENLLRRRDDSEALVFRAEDRIEERLSWRELNERVAAFAGALAAAGVGPGDRVVAIMPNCPATIVAMLATAALGGVRASCAPDFGEQGVLDRFGQVQPRVLVACDGYFYNGKHFDCLPKVAAIAAGMASLEQVVIVPYASDALGTAATTGDIAGATLAADFVAGHGGNGIPFRPMPFDAPLYVLFSSGTTGVPKCIVHSAGGTLLQHLKEHRLHADIGAGDRLFYFTTCTWMMWNWLVSGLAAQATLLLFDGSPFHPGPETLFDYAETEGMTHFGTSAKYIDALKKEGLRPAETHDLASLRVMFSTGSPLVAESFDYVYEAIKADIGLASIAGGTDIVSCFVLGNPLSPVYRGEITGAGLGMAVEVRDENGEPVAGEKGELVCTRPFPSMPVGFWNDDDGSRYRAAYFDVYPNIWAHGDFAEVTVHGGFIIHGRSDATLNPGGVRIGTAEIYRQVEQIDEVMESVVIGQQWDDDVRVVLFVRLREGAALTEALIKTIRDRIRRGASPRHVPAKILAVDDIPRTKSGKITELAVRDVVEGRPVKNTGALANPAALALYQDLPELKA